MAQPISSPRGSSAAGIGCAVVFFAIFALAGAAFLYLMVFGDNARRPPLIAAVVPVVFILVGVGGAAWTVRQAGKKPPAPGVDPLSPFGVPLPLDPAAPLDLRPAATPLGKFVGFTFIALFWNGIVSVFLWQAVKGWRAGAPDGCMTVFLIPFVLIGLALLYGAVRQFLILFNPRVHLTLSPGALTAGQSAVLQWHLSSQGGGVRRLCITLEGREEARYRRGTSTYTDRNVFVTIPVVDTQQSFEIPSGLVQFTVPAGSVPSFQAEHNKIVWSLKTACEIRGWPDSDDEYAVVVRPGRG